MLAKPGEQRSTRYSESNNEYQARASSLCLSPFSLGAASTPALSGGKGERRKKENKRVTTPGGFSSPPPSPVRQTGVARWLAGVESSRSPTFYTSSGFMRAAAVIFLLAWKPLDSSSSSSSSSSLVIVVSPLVGETRPRSQTEVQKKREKIICLSLSLFIFVSPFHRRVDRRTVKRTTRSFALLSSFAGIKSVSLCHGSPSPLFRSRRLTAARFWQEVPPRETSEKSPSRSRATASPPCFPRVARASLLSVYGGFFSFKRLVCSLQCFELVFVLLVASWMGWRWFFFHQGVEVKFTRL